MHRVLRIAVSSFLAITGIFAVTLAADHGLIPLSGQVLGFVAVGVAMCAVRGGMYVRATRRGTEPEPYTRDSVTGAFIVTSCAVAYGWLILGILVGTNAVDSGYQSSVKPLYGWLSLILIVASVVMYGVNLYRLSHGLLPETKPRDRSLAESESLELASHGRA